MLNPPFTGNQELDTYLYQLQLEGVDSASSGGGSAPILPSSAAVVGYTNQYMHVKYADDNLGTGMSNSPTNKPFLGLFNSTSATESSTPADYTWFEVSEGFGTTKFFWYVSLGGRQMNYSISAAGPTALYLQDTGTAIDLDVVTGSGGLTARVCYATTTNNTLSSTPATFASIGNTSFPPIDTWGGQETWGASPITGGVGTSLFQCDGIYNPVSGYTTWNVPYLSTLRVGSLSAISADLGSITAGSLNINNKFIVDRNGNTTIQSGTTGARVYIASNVIKVYDAAGTLRVQIGDLTA